MKEASRTIFSRAAVVLCIATVLAVPALAEERPYEGFQVLSVEPSNEQQIEILSDLNKEAGIDFWAFSPHLLRKNVFSVSPDLLERVSTVLQEAGTEAQVLIPDLQVSIDREAQEQNSTRASLARNPRSVTFDRYMRYHEIEEYAHELQRNYPGRVRVESMGRTLEGREMWVIRVSNQLVPMGGRANNPAVFVDAGIHAREWIAPATVLYLLNQLVENPAVSAELLSGLDWFIVPVLNPDGYEFTHTNSRMWRKNRRRNGNCVGVDLNRNFGFHWNENGASSNPCSDIYSGPQAFSEPESQILRDYILRHRDEITTYLTFHSYGNYILYPWGYTSSLPDDWEDLNNIAREANDAMVAAGSNPYTIGSSTNVLYAAAGGSDDWAKGEAGVQRSYTIELPGGGSQGFDLPPSRIQATVRQVLEGIRIFARHSSNAH